MRSEAERGRFTSNGWVSLLMPWLGLVGLAVRAQFVSIDPAFPADSGPDAYVTALARQSDGQWLVAGTFTHWSGVARSQLVRLNSGGTLDSSFAPQLNADPRRIVPLDDGQIYVVGNFTNVGGVFRSGLARLNSDGSLDGTFDPPGLSSGASLYGGGFVTTNGGVLVTGTFTNLAGQWRPRLARLLPDGSVDPGFQSPFLPGNTVSIVAVQPDDKVIVAGNFQDVGGMPRDGLVRLNPDGSVDSGFQPATGSSNRVTRGILQRDGRLVVAVNTINSSGIPMGPQHLIRLNGDGSRDGAFNVQFDFPGFPFDGVLYGLVQQADGRMMVSGRFLRVNGTPRASVARLQPDGTLDQCFELGLSSEAVILAVETETDGVVIGGSFSMIQGRLHGNLARLIPPAVCDPGVIEFSVPTILAREDEDRVVVPVVRRGGEDLEQTVAFHTRDASATGGQDYDAVSGTLRFAAGERSQTIAVTLHRDSLVEGGESFEVVLGAPGGGATVGSRSNVVVTLDDAPPGTAGAPDTNFVVQLDAPVTSLLPMPDGRVLVGGVFTNVNGQRCPSLVRLTTNGFRDPGFNRSEPLDGDPLALALDAGGRLLVGGRFRNVDGVWQPGGARFNSDGSRDAAFAPFVSWTTNLAGYSVEIEHLMVLADGSIIAGGSVPSGDYGSEGALFKISPTGERDPTFANRIPAGVRVHAMAPCDGGDFLVGGAGLGASLVRLRPDGTFNLSFNPAADRQVAYDSSDPVVLPDGRVVVAGLPASYLGLPGQPLAWRMNSDGSADPAFAVYYDSGSRRRIQSVERLTAAADGRVLIFGTVSTSTGSSAECLRLRADGTLDPTFDQGAGLTGTTTGAGPVLNALVELPAGGWLLAGDFGGYDGFSQRHLVKVLPETLTRPLEFAFAITNLAVTETNGPVTLEVVRRGDASGAASVAVRTADGSATAGQDYVPVDEVIEFAPGEWSRTVTVTVLNDSTIEPVEQFLAVLTNATAGFGIGEPSTVNVQISSDDAGVEFVADRFQGKEEDGYVLAGVRWSGPAPKGVQATVNLIPEVGDAGDLVATSLTITRVLGGTNWVGIGLADNARHQPTRQFRLELVPGINVVPGPQSNATLVIEDLDSATAPSRGVAGVVEAIANAPGGGVYVAGDFTGVHGVPRNRVARLLADGDVDPGFDPGAGPDANVTAIAVQSDGKLLIAGDFTKVSGSAKAHVARLNGDGTLDVTFDPGAGPAITNGVPFLRGLVPHADGSVLIGGVFAVYDGQPRGLLARVHSDGSLDTGFASLFGTPASGSPFDPTSGVAIQSLAATTDAKILPAGYLTPPGPSGTVPSSYSSVVRLTSTGQRDTGFKAVSVNSLDHIAWSVASLADGKVLVGGTGSFGSGQIGTTIVETNWVAIRRFATNGNLDASFRVANAPAILYQSSEIRQMVVQADGRILFVAAILFPDGKFAERIDRVLVGRLQPDGSWDSSFGLVTCALPALGQDGPFWFNSPAVPALRFPAPPVPTVFVAPQPDGVIVLAGSFDFVNGVPRRRIARLDPDGSVRGVLRLGIAPPEPIQLFVPPEVEVPYLIETSPDLQDWLPWRTNNSPWQEWREFVPKDGAGGFFRARGVE